MPYFEVEYTESVLIATKVVVEAETEEQAMDMVCDESGFITHLNEEEMDRSDFESIFAAPASEESIKRYLSQKQQFDMMVERERQRRAKMGTS